MPSKLEWALAYAKAGFFIIELDRNGKEPVGGVRWLGAATNDPDTISYMLSKKDAEGRTPNWGACPGPDKVWLDLDEGFDKQGNPKNGTEKFEALELENGLLPTTLMHSTPSGGRHIALRVPHSVTNANDFPSGIDVRGSHGYVVGPGSEVDGKVYEVIQGGPNEIADAPEWIIEYLRSPGHADPQHDVPLCEWDLEENVSLADEFLYKREPAVQGRNGDNWTVLTAAFCRDFGVSEEKAYELMTRPGGWNNRCVPPWDPEELKVKIKNGYKYSENRPGCKRDLLADVMRKRMTGQLDFDSRSGEDFRSEFELSALERLEKARREMEAEQDIDSEHDEAPATKPVNKRGWYTASGFASRGRRRQYIIPGWMPAHGVTAINAARGVGKSTIMLDLACRMAHGMDWFGIPMMTEHPDKNGDDWCILYLCGEDDEGLELNMIGWHKHHEKDFPEDKLYIRPAITNLMKESDVEDEILALGDIVRGRRCVIFMDTWQRATSHGRQNDDTDMQKAFEAAEILARVLRGPALIAFHPPKDGRQTILGSSIIENNTTAIWFLEEVADGLRLKVTRIKGPGQNNWRKFRKEEVDLESEDQFGKPEIGLIPIKFAGVEDRDKKDALASEAEKRAAWAWAIRGCLEYPYEDNDFEPIPQPNVAQVTTMIADAAWRCNENESCKRFADRYLKPLIEAGITNFTGMPGHPSSTSGGNGPIYRAIHQEFVDEKEGADPRFNFNDDEGTVLVYSPPPGKARPVFHIENNRTRAAEKNKRAKKQAKKKEA